RRLGVGLRPGGEFDPGCRATHAPALRRVPDRAEGRKLPGPRVRLRREGGHAPPAAVPTGPAAPGRGLAGRSPAQERLLCGLRRREGMKACAASPKGRRAMSYDSIAIPDAEVPQAVEPVFRHVLATYASETNKPGGDRERGRPPAPRET